VRRRRVKEGIMPAVKQIDTGKLLGKPPARYSGMDVGGRTARD